MVTGNRLGAGLLFGFAIAAVGPALAGRDTVATQTPAPNACALLTADEVHSLAPKEAVSSGVASVSQAVEATSCHYTWGTGVNRFMLAVSLDTAARAYAGMSSEAIRQQFQSSVVPQTMDATVPEVGDAAIFKAYSPAYAAASAYAKNHIVKVSIDGVDAPARKGDLVTLLKAAVGRL